MCKRRALILCMLPALVFSAAVVILRFPSRAPGRVDISARPAAKEDILSGNDGEQAALELLPGEKLDINTATSQELMRLPGIGEVLSRAIVDYREKNGAFSCIEDIMNVSGIGEGRFSAIEEYICVRGES